MACCDDCNELGLAVGPAGDAGRGYDATSTTSLVLGSIGATVAAVISLEKAYQPGTKYRFSDAASPSANYFEGIVSTYNTSTGAFTGTVTLEVGSGTLTSWYVSVNGVNGTNGSNGANGTNGTTLIYASFSDDSHTGGAGIETLKSTTIAANYPAQDGDVLEIEAGFTMTTGSGSNYVRLTLGGTNVITRADISVTGIAVLKCSAMRSSATTIRFLSFAIIGEVAGIGGDDSNTLLGDVNSLDFTVGFDIRAQANDNAGGSTIACSYMTVKSIAQ